MRNYVQPGHSLPLTAPAGGVVSGSGYLIGSLFVVSQLTVAAGAPFTALIDGVVDLPKATGAVTEGQKIYWNDTTKVVTTTASGNTLIGAATLAALSADATARVRLNGTVS